MEKSKLSFGKIFGIFIVIYILFAMVNTKVDKDKEEEEITYNDKVFSLITTPENKELEEDIIKNTKSLSKILLNVPAIFPHNSNILCINILLLSFNL